MVMFRAEASMLFSTNSATAFNGFCCESAMIVIAFQSSPMRSLPEFFITDQNYQKSPPAHGIISQHPEQPETRPVARLFLFPRSTPRKDRRAAAQLKAGRRRRDAA